MFCNSIVEIFFLLRHQIFVALNVDAFSIGEFSLPELDDQLHQALVEEVKSHYQEIIYHSSNPTITNACAKMMKE